MKTTAFVASLTELLLFMSGWSER